MVEVLNRFLRFLCVHLTETQLKLIISIFAIVRKLKNQSVAKGFFSAVPLMFLPTFFACDSTRIVTDV